MKKIYLLLAACYLGLQPSAFSQGSLTPPGAPAPTMKTLDQIEPRTPISTAPFTINASGSYYLTQNLTVSTGNAITIAANGVNLDLNGFTLSSSAPSANGTAILFSSGVQTATITNGHIRGNFSNGVSFSGTGPTNTRVSDLSVEGSGGVGIDLGVAFPNLIERCTVGPVGGRGLHSGTVSNSVAYNCGGAGIAANIVQGSWGVSTGSLNGIDASSVSNSVGQSTSGTGINALDVSNSTGSSTSGRGITAATVNDSTGTSNTNNGIFGNEVTNCEGTSSNGTADAISAITVNNSRGTSNGGSGINCSTAQNSYGVSSSFIGLLASNAASNCYGRSTSSAGLAAGLTNNCFGESTNGIGLQAYRAAFGSFASTSNAGVAALSTAGIASYCSGMNPGGTAINCVIAIGCSTFAGSIVAPQGKYLGTP